MNQVMQALGLESRITFIILEKHGQWVRFSCSNCGENYRKKIIPDYCPSCKQRVAVIRDLT